MRSSFPEIRVLAAAAAAAVVVVVVVVGIVGGRV